MVKDPSLAVETGVVMLPSSETPPLVDVVVPVYRGYVETTTCLKSVLANANQQLFELVIVDDCSPDPVISSYLDSLSNTGQATVLRNSTNLGFVASVNRGMALHPERDVVLLNSDTEVANDWLDRLRKCAYAAPDIGTVTPFSNNATICSYPYEGWPEGIPGGLGLAGLDKLCAETNAGQSVDLPTAVGFCMYIRRACLDAVGLFDVERFGRGYGEENDFCLRATTAGWRHKLAGDVFVYHEGGVSFSDERAGLQARAMARLLEIHPDYLERVRGFLAEDPAAPLRDAIDMARVGQGSAEARHVVAEQKRKQLHVYGENRWEATLVGLREALGTVSALERGLAHAERLVGERDSEIAKLTEALARVEALAVERGTALDQTNLSLQKVTQTMQHVESQLAYIKSTRVWRLISKLRKLSRHTVG